MSPTQECLTTNLSNELALKMDSAEAGSLHATIVARVSASMSRRVWGFL